MEKGGGRIARRRQAKPFGSGPGGGRQRRVSSSAPATAKRSQGGLSIGWRRPLTRNSGITTLFDTTEWLSRYGKLLQKGVAMDGKLEAGQDSVDSIWRYPVKSMAGEEIPMARVTPRGLLGDRVYALVDKASNRAATVRTWAATLLSYRPQFLTEPELGVPPPAVRIAMPDGRALSTADPDIH
jgi:MOSC N-terminal beta barrel domain